MIIDMNLWNICCYNQSAPRDPAWYPVVCNVSNHNLSFFNCALPFNNSTSCVTNYYGNGCNVYCDSSSQRYTCDDNGSRKCKSNFHGTQCLPESFYEAFVTHLVLFILFVIGVIGCIIMHQLRLRSVGRRQDEDFKKRSAVRDAKRQTAANTKPNSKVEQDLDTTGGYLDVVNTSNAHNNSQSLTISHQSIYPLKAT